MERVAEGPPYNVFIKTIGFRGAILAERVFHEGREVAENSEFIGIAKVEVVDDGEVNVYLWEGGRRGPGGGVRRLLEEAVGHVREDIR